MLAVATWGFALVLGVVLLIAWIIYGAINVFGKRSREDVGAELELAPNRKERLIGKGYDVSIYDANVNLAKLVGANRSYILDQIPHISDLMVSSIGQVLDHARTLVIGNNDPAFRAVIERPRPGQRIVDLVHIVDRRSDGNAYDGICW